MALIPWEQLPGIVVNAVMISSLYALVAIGFTIIFGVGGILNLAHGASIAIGAFSAFYASSMFDLPVWGALLAAAAGAAAFSGLLYLAMIRHVEDEPIMVMILSLVTAVAIEQVLLALHSQPVPVPSLLDGVTSAFGASILHNLVAVFAISWLIIGALFAFVNYTKPGKALLATSMTHKGAALVGIDSDRITLGTWILAGALAGLAGMFLGSFQGATWDMGRTPLILSFSIVVIGGIGSIRGSVVGAYLIGTLETLTTSLIDPRLQGMVSLLALVIVLLVKPEGLFGRELVE